MENYETGENCDQVSQKKQILFLCRTIKILNSTNATEFEIQIDVSI